MFYFFCTPAQADRNDHILRSTYSVEWMKFGGQLSLSRESLKRFFASLRRCRPFLHHIPLISVQVVDHLGQNIPVPILFCSTWKVRGLYFFHTSFRSTSSRARTFATLSMAIAMIVLGTTSSSEVTIKSYAPEIVKLSAPRNLPTW